MILWLKAVLYTSFSLQEYDREFEIELEDQFTVVESKYKDIGRHTVVKLF